ncbi:MAG TPA: DUF2997 domain-containing protein [Phycisphaerae bacterium]|nr:DUF2997 domain-containing protein [Phycisphaerae bacterium]
MERPEFEITITRAGKVKVHVKGVKGQRCVELADLIKEIVGREDERKLTDDFYALDGKVRIDVKTRTS